MNGIERIASILAEDMKRCHKVYEDTNIYNPRLLYANDSYEIDIKSDKDIKDEDEFALIKDKLEPIYLKLLFKALGQKDEMFSNMSVVNKRRFIKEAKEIIELRK